MEQEYVDGLRESEIFKIYQAMEKGKIRINPKYTMPVLVVGKSGTGKSSAIGTVGDWTQDDKIKQLGLPPSKTLVVNSEEKPDTSRGKQAYTEILVRTMNDFIQVQQEIIIATNIPVDKEKRKEWVKRYENNVSLRKFLDKDFIVYDSVSAISGLVMEWCRWKTKQDDWKSYNLFKTTMPQVLNPMKKIKAQVFVTALPEDKTEMGKKMSAGIEGQKLNEWLESLFNIVLWTNPEYTQDENEEMIESYLQYRSNARNTAKSPVGIFKGKLKADYLEVALAIQRFKGGKDWAEIIPERTGNNK